MIITLLKIGAAILVVLATGTLVARNAFSFLARRNFESSGRTPRFLQIHDPYIAGLVEALYENKKNSRSEAK